MFDISMKIGDRVISVNRESGLAVLAPAARISYTAVMRVISDAEVVSFRRRLLGFYRKHHRDLPWRNTTDPYCITISEVMLQQTQVERVIPKYKAWITRWPSWEQLAAASPRQLLTAWSGLGYNRRALFLGKLGQTIAHEYGGILPRQQEQLRALPGIGPYTANAILIFAFNRPLATIDTNVRRVLLHEFSLPASTSRKELEALALRLVPRRNSRDWHNALMDYGSLVLPRRIAAIPPLSRQSRFKGSLRQIRGEIVRRLTSRRSTSLRQIARDMGRTSTDVAAAAETLQKNGIVRISKNRVMLVE